MISFTSAGLDKLAPFEWVPEGVAVLNNRGTHADKAGEFGIMAVLMIRNGLPWFAHDAREGRWAPRFGAILAGATLGVLGLGSLGGGIALRARQFGMRVIGVRGTPRPHEHCDEVHGEGALDAVLPRLDFLAIACPLTERTRNIVSRARLQLLPRGAGVVNVARGAVWDQDAACDLLDLVIWAVASPMWRCLSLCPPSIGCGGPQACSSRPTCRATTLQHTTTERLTFCWPTSRPAAMADPCPTKSTLYGGTEIQAATSERGGQ